MNKSTFICCIFLLTLLTQAGNVQAAETSLKQVKSIADGFRGVPWGIKESEAKSYGLTCDREESETERIRIRLEMPRECYKKNENLSLGDVQLISISYKFNIKRQDGNEFGSVMMTVSKLHENGLSQELIKLFGEPKVETSRVRNSDYDDSFRTSAHMKWDLDEINVTYHHCYGGRCPYSSDNAKAWITYKEKKSSHRGGGL